MGGGGGVRTSCCAGLGRKWCCSGWSPGCAVVVVLASAGKERSGEVLAIMPFCTMKCYCRTQRKDSEARCVRRDVDALSASSKEREKERYEHNHSHTLTHSLTHSLTHTHSLPHSLTHSNRERTSDAADTVKPPRFCNFVVVEIGWLLFEEDEPRHAIGFWSDTNSVEMTSSGFVDDSYGCHEKDRPGPCGAICLCQILQSVLTETIMASITNETCPAGPHRSTSNEPGGSSPGTLIVSFRCYPS